MALQDLDVRTSRRVELIDITARVAEAVRSAGADEATCLVFVPHTTAGVTVNENADPAVVRDMIAALDRLVPRSERYEHREGNSDAHIKATLVGSSVRLPVSAGRLRLGTWQGIWFCEFDGPRSRRVVVQVR